MTDKEEYEVLLESTQEDHEEYIATEKEIQALTRPIQETEFKTQTGKYEPIIFQEAELIEAPQAETKAEELEADFQEARKNIYNGIQIAQDSLAKLAQIADGSQHPRAYEVVALLAKTIVDSSKTLIDLHEKQKDIIEPTDDEAGKTVNNNLFIGSTEELDKLIEKLKS